MGPRHQWSRHSFLTFYGTVWFLQRARDVPHAKVASTNRKARPTECSGENFGRLARTRGRPSPVEPAQEPFAGLAPPPRASPPQLLQPNHFLKNSLNLFDVFVTDAFATAVAALQAVENVLPHGAGRREAARPLAATLQLPAKTPFAGELLRTKKPPLPRDVIGVGPLDVHVRCHASWSSRY